MTSRALCVYVTMLGVANGLIAWGGVSLVGALRRSYAQLLGTTGLPAITSVALQLPLVFAVLGVVCVALPVVSRRDPVSKAWAVHSVAAIVGLEIGMLVFGLVGLVVPFFTLTWTLGGAQ